MSSSLNGTGVTFSDSSTQSSSALGYSQTWQNVTGSRAVGTTYTNTTGRSIFVTTYCTGSNQNQTITVNGVTVGECYIGNYTNGGSWFIVPASGTYSISSGNTLVNWAELR